MRVIVTGARGHVGTSVLRFRRSWMRLMGDGPGLFSERRTGTGTRTSDRLVIPIRRAVGDCREAP
jgi:hypothetical protein